MEQKFISKEIEGSKNAKLDKLRRLFPNVVKDGQVDFDELKNELGEFEETSNEKYEFLWVGKQYAKQDALSGIKGATLKYYPNESKNPDTTENLYIEGDNLDVLKLLRNNYSNKIKMIYIDPPYNTGNDFVYNDSFKNDSIDTENKMELSSEGIKNIAINKDLYYKNQKDSSNYHSNWLNMMYPRLKIAWELLTEDGIIFVSIDDNEVENLKKLLIEIFGEKNFVSQLVWKSKSGGANDSKNIAIDHEYILTFAKDYDKLSLNLDKDAQVTSNYNNVDENGKRYSLERLDKQSLGYIESLDFPIIGTDGKKYVVEHKDPNNKIARWRWGKDTVKERYNELVFKYPYVYTKNYEKDGVIPRSLLVDERFGRTRTGKTDLKILFNDIDVFDFPKPVSLIQYFCDITLKENDIVLDFFSGSGTLAQALFNSNIKNSSTNKFILVQLAEECDKKSKAYNNGYKNICEIGKERIRRAGDKIKQETNADIDYGFKVFKLAETNINWEKEEYKKNIDNYILNLDSEKEKKLQDFVDGAKDIDIVYELLLRYYGMPLSAKIDKVESIGNRTYSINDVIVICLEDEITNEIIDKLSRIDFAKLYLRDSSFKGNNSLETKENLMIRLNLQKEYNNEKSYRVEFI